MKELLAFSISKQCNLETKLFRFIKSCDMFSLENLCLNLIVQKFELFNFAFSASNDENMQRNFKFLQRRYSIQLVTALHAEDKIKEEYLELLINEQLNFFVGKWFEKTHYLNCMERIFCRLPNLTRICFKNCEDEILENITRFCPKIVEIDVRNSNVTDEGVKYLYEKRNGRVPCPELKNLFIRSSKVTDRGVKRLIQNLPSLEKLDYANFPLLLHSIYKEKFTLIKRVLRLEEVRCCNLVELNLSEFPRLSYYTNVLKTCLTVCPKLESITCYINDKKQLGFFASSHLKKLCLEFWFKCPVINVNKFLRENGHNWTSLKISNPPSLYRTECNMSVYVLAAYCPSLEEFYAHNVTFRNDVDDDRLEVVFPSLIKCCFSLVDPSDAKAICMFLSSSPKLECLSFRFMYKLSKEIKNEISVWCKNSSAKLIEFVHLELEKQYIEDVLLNSANLKALFLLQCKIGFYNRDMDSFLCTFLEKRYSLSRIFLQRYEPLAIMSDLEELHVINYINHNAIFNGNSRNLENYLTDEYKYSSISNSLFTEIAFHGFFRDTGDNWLNNWEII